MEQEVNFVGPESFRSIGPEWVRRDDSRIRTEVLGTGARAQCRAAKSWMKKKGRIMSCRVGTLSFDSTTPKRPFPKRQKIRSLRHQRSSELAYIYEPLFLPWTLFCTYMKLSKNISPSISLLPDV